MLPIMPVLCNMHPQQNEFLSLHYNNGIKLELELKRGQRIPRIFCSISVP